jgi:hypothetical protein
LLSTWVECAQNKWEVGRTSKSEIEFPRVIDRLDRYKCVTNQNPSLRYLVLYNARGANAVAYVLDRLNIPILLVANEVGLNKRVFIADYTTYYFDTNDENEAHYICAMINSTIINKKVKPFQPRGKYGKRDIGIRPFMLPIPKFDYSKTEHQSLVELGKKCHKIIANHTFDRIGFKIMRNEALLLLSKEIAEIDRNVLKILMSNK